MVDIIFTGSARVSNAFGDGSMTYRISFRNIRQLHLSYGEFGDVIQVELFGNDGPYQVFSVGTSFGDIGEIVAIDVRLG